MKTHPEVPPGSKFFVESADMVEFNCPTAMLAWQVFAQMNEQTRFIVAAVAIEEWLESWRSGASSFILATARANQWRYWAKGETLSE